MSWLRHQMETFSAILAICAGNSPVIGEFPTQRPVTRSFDVFFDLCLNKQLSKQSWGWWFETPPRPLWRHCNGLHKPPKIILPDGYNPQATIPLRLAGLGLSLIDIYWGVHQNKVSQAQVYKSFTESVPTGRFNTVFHRPQMSCKFVISEDIHWYISVVFISRLPMSATVSRGYLEI